MEEEVHPIFLQDPAHWMQYISKKVCILTENNHEHIGWVFTVDPVSTTFVLAQFSSDGKTEVEIVMGHAVKKVTILDVDSLEENSDLKEKTIHEKLNSLFVHKFSSEYSESNFATRKEQLRSWLLKNRLPVDEKEDQSLCIADVVTVTPPYTAETCISINEIILAKIQGLIKSMPEELDGLWMFCLYINCSIFVCNILPSPYFWN